MRQKEVNSLRKRYRPVKPPEASVVALTGRFHVELYLRRSSELLIRSTWRRERPNSIDVCSWALVVVRPLRTSSSTRAHIATSRSHRAAGGGFGIVRPARLAILRARVESPTKRTKRRQDKRSPSIIAYVQQELHRLDGPIALQPRPCPLFAPSPIPMAGALRHRHSSGAPGA